jgi:2-phosphosulfolactate phosphatase
MRIDVALLPGQRCDLQRSVCVVVDVLRASSSVVTLLESGAAAVAAAADIAEARRLHERLGDHLLCGEQGGLPPPGFDHGNSPSEFARLNLAGRRVILATSNGTRVLAAVADAPAVLAGCLLNRTAVARAAVSIARECDLDVTVFCSGAHAGSTFVLEDALGAGAIVDAALMADQPVQAGDAARFARDAFTVAQADLPAAVASAYHAAELVEDGLGDDVAFCSRLDTSGVAPLVQRGEDGVLVLRAWREG